MHEDIQCSTALLSHTYAASTRRPTSSTNRRWIFRDEKTTSTFGMAG